MLSYGFVPARWLLHLLCNNPIGHPKAEAVHPSMCAGWLPGRWVTTGRKRGVLLNFPLKGNSFESPKVICMKLSGI